MDQEFYELVVTTNINGEIATKTYRAIAHSVSEHGLSIEVVYGWMPTDFIFIFNPYVVEAQFDKQECLRMMGKAHGSFVLK